ncbi:MAG TPA: metal ABC transporter substrate-binding protein [Haliangiales bacterium]|nr:metal ABC transporter substrate-binding protein [Haliangiales bacterium]
MRKLFAVFVLLCAADAAAAVKVVATVPDLAAVAAAVGGDKVSVTSLALPTQDPHFVDAKPSLVIDVNAADLLIAVGLELEIGWLPVLQTSARNPKIMVGGPGFLDCSRFVKLMDIPDRPVDRSQGDIHPGGNPHYLHDPRAVALVAQGIAAKLGEIDPANAPAYQKNAAAFLAQLDAARGRWEARMARYRGAPIVQYHRSWVYMVDWLGLTTIEYVEPKPGIPPTATHVARVLVLAREKKVKAILQESFYPDATSEVLAQKIPTSLVILPGGTNVKGGQTYVEHMEEIVTAIERALSKS